MGMRCAVWGVRCGVCGMRYAVWGVRYAVFGVRYGANLVFRLLDGLETTFVIAATIH